MPRKKERDNTRVNTEQIWPLTEHVCQDKVRTLQVSICLRELLCHNDDLPDLWTQPVAACCQCRQGIMTSSTSTRRPCWTATSRRGCRGPGAWRGRGGRSCGTGGGTRATATWWWGAGRTRATPSPGTNTQQMSWSVILDPDSWSWFMIQIHDPDPSSMILIHDLDSWSWFMILIHHPSWFMVLIQDPDPSSSILIHGPDSWSWSIIHDPDSWSWSTSQVVHPVLPGHHDEQQESEPRPAAHQQLQQGHDRRDGGEDPHQQDEGHVGILWPYLLNYHCDTIFRYPETFRGQSSVYNYQLGRCMTSHDSPGFRYYRSHSCLRLLECLYTSWRHVCHVSWSVSCHM